MYHYLGDKQNFDVSSDDPSSGIGSNLYKLSLSQINFMFGRSHCKFRFVSFSDCLQASILHFQILLQLFVRYELEVRTR